MKKISGFEWLKWGTGLLISAVTISVLYLSGAFEVQSKLLELKKKELIDSTNKLALVIDSLQKSIDKKNLAISSLKENIASLNTERTHLKETVTGLEKQKEKLDSIITGQGRALMGVANYQANFLEKMNYNHNMLVADYKELKLKYDTCQAQGERLRKQLNNY